MFDVGWQELFIIGLVAIVVIGPKDLPRVLRTVTLGIRKVRSMARDFQDGLEELARDADLQELRKEIEDGVGGDLQDEIESIGDPARDIEESVREIGDTLNEPETPKVSSAATETATGETPAAETASAETVAAETPAAETPSDGADEKEKKTGGAA